MIFTLGTVRVQCAAVQQYKRGRNPAEYKENPCVCPSIQPPPQPATVGLWRDGQTDVKMLCLLIVSGIDMLLSTAWQVLAVVTKTPRNNHKCSDSLG